MPATEGLAPDVHALFFSVHAGARERKMCWGQRVEAPKASVGMGMGYPSSHSTIVLVWGSVMSSPVGVWDGAPAQNEFDAFLYSPCRWWKRFRMFCSISSNAETVIVYIYMQVFLCTKYVNAGQYLSDIS